MSLGTDETSNKANLNEMKQTFLLNAIVDISTYIQLADTKVSIIMGALVALIAGIIACYEPIEKILSKITPCSWIGVFIVFMSLLCTLSLIAVFIFGILTIREHASVINYNSKWFLSKTCKMYSFDMYKDDIEEMGEKDIIENIVVELYKLNDINRQKSITLKWAIRFFSSTLVTSLVIVVVLIFADF